MLDLLKMFVVFVVIWTMLMAGQTSASTGTRKMYTAESSASSSPSGGAAPLPPLPQPPPEDDVEITLFDVPSYVRQGHDVELRCEFQSSHQMYSIKWYRVDKEFFYYIPSLDPPKRVLPMPGVDVDTEKSDGRKLRLLNVSLDTEGRYKCEVSTEWPHYYTADKSDVMQVFVIPDVKPMIYGALEKYRLGDTARLMCMSAPSKPEGALTWYINGREALPHLLDPLPLDPDGRLHRSRLSLSFVVTKDHFVRGKLTIECSSVVASHRLTERIVFNVPVMDAEERAALAGVSTSGARRGFQHPRGAVLWQAGFVLGSLLVSFSERKSIAVT